MKLSQVLCCFGVEEDRPLNQIVVSILGPSPNARKRASRAEQVGLKSRYTETGSYSKE